MDVEIIVPIGFFAAIVASIWLISHFSFKKRQTIHETLRHAITNGQQVSGDLIERMSQISDPARADFRRGVLFIAFGVAVMTLGGIISSQEGESFMPVLGLASFPIILGLAYLGLWGFGKSNSGA